MTNYFFVDNHQDVFYIKYRTLDGLPFTCPIGSYNVLKSRLFNETYPDYLRLARNNYGATLRGKVGYMIEIFMDKAKAEKLCKELNRRLNKVLKEVGIDESLISN